MKKENVIGQFNCIDSTVSLGDNIIIGSHCSISGHVFIDDNVYIGSNVCMSSDPQPPSSPINWNKITIREYATIADGSCILAGVTIGRNAKIGVGSIVTKNVPDNEIWVGNPAKRISKGHKYVKD